jgi:hypothetical protein
LIIKSKKTAITSVGSLNTIAFNTIARNGELGILIYADSKGVADRSLVVNNIVCSNSDCGMSLSNESKNVRVGGNDVYGNMEGGITGPFTDIGGNLAVPPIFKAGSCALAAGSPLIDKAIGAYTVAYDITGAKRVKPDIGAYEYVINR